MVDGTGRELQIVRIRSKLAKGEASRTYTGGSVSARDVVTAWTASAGGSSSERGDTMTQEEFNTMLQAAIAQGLPGGHCTSKYSGEEMDALLDWAAEKKAEKEQV